MPISPTLNQAERAWIDWRWSWLSQQYGGEAARLAHVPLTANEFLRHRGMMTDQEAQVALEAICKSMGFDSGAPRLIIRDVDSPAEQAELDEQLEAASADGVIAAHIYTDALTSPAECVALMAKQVVLAHLLGDSSFEAEGAEALAVGELGAVYFGCGVVLANVAVVDVTWSDADLWHHSRVQRNTCMSIPMFGYALARFAHHRVERDPAWAASLQPDSRSQFKRHIRDFESNPPSTASAGKPAINPFIKNNENPETEEAWAPAVLEEDLDTKVDSNETLYCTNCGCHLSSLSPGLCPGCNCAFDPEDLRTVATERPVFIPESIKVLGRLSRKVIQVVIVILCILIVITMLNVLFGGLP